MAPVQLASLLRRTIALPGRQALSNLQLFATSSQSHSRSTSGTVSDELSSLSDSASARTSITSVSSIATSIASVVGIASFPTAPPSVRAVEEPTSPQAGPEPAATEEAALDEEEIELLSECETAIAQLEMDDEMKALLTKLMMAQVRSLRWPSFTRAGFELGSREANVSIRREPIPEPPVARTPASFTSKLSTGLSGMFKHVAVSRTRIL